MDFNKLLNRAVLDTKPSGIRKFFDLAAEIEALVALVLQSVVVIVVGNIILEVPVVVIMLKPCSYLKVIVPQVDVCQVYFTPLVPEIKIVLVLGRLVDIHVHSAHLVVELYLWKIF